MIRNSRTRTAPFFTPVVMVVLAIVALIAACSLSGCANLGAATSSTTVVPTNTINDQAALTYDAINLASTTINTLLRAGKMSLADHKTWQGKLTDLYVATGTATTIAQLQSLQQQAAQVTTSNGGTAK